MLWHILDAHGGRLPNDVHVTFANTGKERPETLDFVAECERRWGMHIAWLEWRDDRYGPNKFEIVNHNSASRNGEPFAALIDRKGFLPNPVMRFCTQKLKIETIHAYARQTLGWSTWTEVVGLRSDEPGRAERSMNNPRNGPRKVVCPMYEAGVTEQDVLSFWREQPFDLQLQSYEGNCDLCFLKGAGKITRIMRERPDLAKWWIDQENRIKARSGAAGKFRSDRPDYATLLDTTQRQGVLPFSFFDDHQDCETGCTDQEPEADLCNLRRRA
jgi:3'-phosphoadenosine 5'-phosphosulfate sulfotransferase (PAPS reductase)/FAD synthetase